MSLALSRAVAITADLLLSLLSMQDLYYHLNYRITSYTQVPLYFLSGSVKLIHKEEECVRVIYLYPWMLDCWFHLLPNWHPLSAFPSQKENNKPSEVQTELVYSFSGSSTNKFQIKWKTQPLNLLSNYTWFWSVGLGYCFFF